MGNMFRQIGITQIILLSDQGKVTPAFLNKNTSFLAILYQTISFIQKIAKHEPVHEISNVVSATSKGSDQHVHVRSLIRAFASCLSILWLLSY